MTGSLRGITLMVLSMAGFAIEDMSIKLVSQGGMPTGQILAIIAAGGILFFAALSRLRGVSLLSRDAIHPTVAWRNLGEVVGTAGFVIAITLAQLSTATAVFQALPLAVTLGAALFLGESVGWRRWSAIIIGLVGVMIIIRPGLSGFDPYALWSVVAVVGLALRDLATRGIPPRVQTVQVAGWGMVSVLILGLVMLAISGGAVLPDRRAVALLAFAMTAGFLAYWALTEATRVAEAGATTPFRYVRLLFALIIGVVVFHERPDPWTWIGAALIVGSGLYTLARERRLRRLSTQAPAR